MSKTKLKKLIHTHFKTRLNYERLWCDQMVLPFAEKLIQNTKQDCIERGWAYIVEATRNESWSKDEFIKALAFKDLV